MKDAPDMKISLLEQGHFEFLEPVASEVAPKPKKSKPKPGTISTASAAPAATSGMEALISHRTGKPRVFKGKKHIISVSIAPHVLSKVDEWANKRGMSRPAAIAFALTLLPD